MSLSMSTDLCRPRGRRLGSIESRKATKGCRSAGQPPGAGQAAHLAPVAERNGTGGDRGSGAKQSRTRNGRMFLGGWGAGFVFPLHLVGVFDFLPIVCFEVLTDRSPRPTTNAPWWNRGLVPECKGRAERLWCWGLALWVWLSHHHFPPTVPPKSERERGGEKRLRKLREREREAWQKCH